MFEKFSEMKYRDIIHYNGAISRWYPPKTALPAIAYAWQIGPFWQDNLDYDVLIDWNYFYIAFPASID